jgi:hypothetical protein
MIRITCSGLYTNIVPQVRVRIYRYHQPLAEQVLLLQLRYHLGPTILLQSFVYGATECTVGYRYDALDLSLFKVEKPESVELKQAVSL